MLYFILGFVAGAFASPAVVYLIACHWMEIEARGPYPLSWHPLSWLHWILCRFGAERQDPY